MTAARGRQPASKASGRRLRRRPPPSIGPNTTQPHCVRRATTREETQGEEGEVGERRGRGRQGRAHIHVSSRLTALPRSRTPSREAHPAGSLRIWPASFGSSRPWGLDSLLASARCRPGCPSLTTLTCHTAPRLTQSSHRRRPAAAHQRPVRPPMGRPHLAPPTLRRPRRPGPCRPQGIGGCRWAPRPLSRLAR